MSDEKNEGQGDLPEIRKEPPKRSDKAWLQPKETRLNESLRLAGSRLLMFLLAIYAVYFLVSRTTHMFFEPLLEIEEVVAPAEPTEIGAPVRLGLKVKNVRFEKGAGYVVAVVDGESEVEGPVVEVPERETRELPVEVALKPGKHVVALILYDAWKENVRQDARYGIPVQVGRAEIVAETAILPAVVKGQDFEFALTVSNRGGIPQNVVTLLVFQSSAPGAAPVEVESAHSVAVEPGDSVTHRVKASARKLEPGRYNVAVVFLDASGKKTGRGLYRIPVVVRER